MKRLLLTGCLLSGLLTSCSEDEPAVRPAVLTIALPSPATPGQEVTVYGRLPSSVLAVQLNSESVPEGALRINASPVKDGLRFTLPVDVVAGFYDLTVPTIEGQKLPLDVIPRLDRVTLNGSVLTVQGAGWGGKPTNALVEVNGQRMVPQGQGDILTVAVNAAKVAGATTSDLYGTLNVRVVVGERASDTGVVKKEARRAQGRVSPPVTPSTTAVLSVQAESGVTLTSTSRTLLLPFAGSAPLEGRVAVQTLPSLGAARVTYETLAQATQAYRLLRRQGVPVEYDLPLTLHEGPKVQAHDSAVHVTALNQQWWWPLLGLPGVWAETRGEGITVAVVDTGVAFDHPELQSQVLPGWDFVENDPIPQDLSGHGTHVAGLIAAHGTLRGAAPGASILPVRVIGPDGGAVSDLITGMLWAAGLDTERPNPHPAQVINLSLGTPEYSDLLHKAVGKLLEHGVIVVAANGNDGGLPYAPANIPGVIAVTAISGPLQAYQPAYANRGPGTRLAAYGGDLNADQDKDGIRDGLLSADIDASGKPAYAYRHGTSMAAPQVSGVAALMIARGVPPRLVKGLLEGQAIDLGVSGMDLSTGWGLVNAGPLQADPDLYVAALDTEGQVITYVRPKAGVFDLGSLPPQAPVTLVAGTDTDHDGVIGEAGEMLSPPFTLGIGVKAYDLELQLSPSSGIRALLLPR